MLPPARATLAGVVVGADLPVTVIGALNVSPDSFYAGSVHRPEAGLLEAALAMVAAGAALIDVGARSTAPYRATGVSEAEETARLARAVQVLVAKLPVPISADTTRPGPARAALEAGARVVNDVSGLRDPAMAQLAAHHGASVILMASPTSVAGGGGPSSTTTAPRSPIPSSDPQRPGDADDTGLGRAPAPRPAPIEVVEALLVAALGRAREAGIPDDRIVLDPGVGFFRDVPSGWVEWDLRVLAGLQRLSGLGRPLCVGVSRKSFVGAVTGRADPADRLAGSLAATTVAVVHGAAAVRAHDVRATVDAVRVAERLREGGGA
ncbi:MAG: dihydropteroate synthase [Candidatus Rokubacteria bacterium]|nr:dihydropteroate synthase [Candidatus Rokubacteria bacterium]